MRPLPAALLPAPISGSLRRLDGGPGGVLGAGRSDGRSRALSSGPVGSPRAYGGDHVQLGDREEQEAHRCHDEVVGLSDAHVERLAPEAISGRVLQIGMELVNALKIPLELGQVVRHGDRAAYGTGG